MPRRSWPLLLAAGVVLCACSRAPAPAFRLKLLASDRYGGGDAALSPDGRRFVISSRRSGNWDLWVYTVDTQSWARLTDHPADDFEAQWSPTGDRLAFSSTRSGNKDVWVLSMADGTLRPVTDGPEDEEYPAWSPDGRSIVYTGGPWRARDFLVTPAAGGMARRVTARPGHVGACSFFPDGGSLICHGYDAGTGDVFRLPLSGGSPRELTNGPAWDYKPSVSPRNGWFAFSRSLEGPSRIHLQNLRGGSPHVLATSAYDDRWPTWSASGAHLLFHRLVERGAGVRLLDRRRGTVETVVAADEHPGQASLSPDGRALVYSARRADRQILRLRDLGEDSVRDLDAGPGDAGFPRWSPDAARIAFVCKERSRWEVCTLELSTGVRTIWTRAWPELHGLYGPLDWSPDGERVLFKADTGPFEADLFELRVPTGALRRLTQDEWWDEAPSWTGGGRDVLFMSTRGGNWTWGLFRLGPDGVAHAVVAADYTEKNHPRAGPHGVIAWSVVDEAGLESVAELSPEGQVRVLPQATGGRWPSYSSDGRWLVFTAVERTVEYWLAENVFSPPSPLVRVAEGREGDRGAAQEAVAIVPSALRDSPHHLHHR